MKTEIFLGRPKRVTPTEMELLDTLYDGAGKAGGWQDFLDLLSKTYPGGQGALVLHDASMRTGNSEAFAGWDQNYIDSYNRFYASLNPWQARVARQPVGVAAPAEFLVRQRELEQTEFYNDWLKPQGLATGLGLVLQRDGSRFLSVTVLYPRTTSADPDAVLRLQRLAPHIMRVAQLNRQIATLEMQVAASQSALVAQETAMLIVNDAGQVVDMNASAEKLLAKARGLKITGKQVEATLPADKQIFARLVADACRARDRSDAAPGGILRVWRGPSQCPLEVLISPAPAAAPRGTSLAVVFIRDPDARPTAPIEHLRAMFALTAAEARLLAGLLGKDTLETFAAHSGVSTETLRTQLKSIFQKTKTNSQMELVRYCMRGLGPFKSARI